MPRLMMSRIIEKLNSRYKPPVYNLSRAQHLGQYSKNSCNSLTDACALLGCLVRKVARRRSSIACIENNFYEPATRIKQLVLRVVYVRDLARARSRRVGTGAE
jgi:hypothetical protein